MNFIALGQILTHLLGFKYPFHVHWGEIFAGCFFFRGVGRWGSPREGGKFKEREESWEAGKILRETLYLGSLQSVLVPVREIDTLVNLVTE